MGYGPWHPELAPASTTTERTTTMTYRLEWCAVRTSARPDPETFMLARVDTLARMIPAWNAAVATNGAAAVYGPDQNYGTALHRCLAVGKARDGGTVASLHIIARGTLRVVDELAELGHVVDRSHYVAMLAHLPADWAPTT